ncbi:hypothetical protein SYNPS1DRAFT_26546 [Syncephalis pseudoplumigaleata]|uniref:Uncharacterized protein n=1 Tax=Syncephalis pseudoplumigaleata TaxID=1712513 RepID=A0A4P9Z5B3_9FUNG|nr:hypothetical protein SYNPS1DRAFT_26546 [Syncephalis pseudoplumigaleata]|eukprot:RKP27814.1 hypothetical protein SYNPS1DRAFT_26546 [Syncephalis pseudoplumigaleata]
MYTILLALVALCLLPIICASGSDRPKVFHGKPIKTRHVFIAGLRLDRVLPARDGATFAEGTYQPDPKVKKRRVQVMCGMDGITRYTAFRVFRSFETLSPPTDRAIAEGRQYVLQWWTTFDVDDGGMRHCYVILHPWKQCHKQIDNALTSLSSTLKLAKKALRQIELGKYRADDY